MGVVWEDVYVTHVQGERVGSQWHDLECVMRFKGCLWLGEVTLRNGITLLGLPRGMLFFGQEEGCVMT